MLSTACRLVEGEFIHPERAVFYKNVLNRGFYFQCRYNDTQGYNKINYAGEICCCSFGQVAIVVALPVRVKDITAERSLFSASSYLPG